MLGQSQDRLPGRDRRACELIDFWRFNVALRPADPRRAADLSPACGTARVPAARGLRLRDHAVQLHRDRRQPADRAGADGQHRRLEAAPTQQLAAHFTMKLLEEAGLPPGVINWCPATGSRSPTSRSPTRDLAGIHFTGSTAVFQHLWKTVGENIDSLPRLPAHRRRDRRQGLRRRAPERRRRRAAHRDRPRRLRVPGPEVLGGLARLRPASNLWPSCATTSSR
jgi:1-pyrroline-5-carboxylate dehydrogenase